MADNVIRRVTILADWKRGTVEAKPPDMGGLLEAKERDVQLTQQLADATHGLNAATVKQGDAALQSFAAQSKGTREVAEGVFRIARATALLAGLNDDSMQSLVRNLALVQAGFDIFKGGSIIIRGLSTMNPLMAGLGVAVGAAALAWDRYNAAQRRAAEEMERFQKTRQELLGMTDGNLSEEQQLKVNAGEINRVRSELDKERRSVDQSTWQWLTSRGDIAPEAMAADKEKQITLLKELLELEDKRRRILEQQAASREREKNAAIKEAEDDDPFKGKLFGDSAEVSRLKDELSKLETESKKAIEANRRAWTNHYNAAMEMNQEISKLRGAIRSGTR